VERHEAQLKLSELVGQDLRQLAGQYGITVWKDKKLNKGWAGQVIERHLGLPLNSSRAPNLGSWELKLVSLKRSPNGELKVKETMAITMIDPVEVCNKSFEESHLFRKLSKALIVARVYEGPDEQKSIVYKVTDFQLSDQSVYEQVKADYELVRQTIITQGFSALTGKMGVLIQPRTKGPGHGSTSRAFYARTNFVKKIVGL